MPDQLWVLGQVIEFQQGLSGWNRNHVSDNMVPQTEHSPVKRPPGDYFWQSCGHRARLRIASKATSFWLNFCLFIFREKSTLCFVFEGEGATPKNIMLWLNSLRTANNPRKLWILTSHVREEKTITIVCSLPVLTELHLCWHFGFSKPLLCTSEIFVLWGMPYISPFSHRCACHRNTLNQPFQGCSLLPPVIKPRVLTRKAYTGPEFNSVMKSIFNHEIFFFPGVCWETALGFRSRAESFRSRRVALLSLANAFYLKINKLINNKSLLLVFLPHMPVSQLFFLIINQPVSLMQLCLSAGIKAWQYLIILYFIEA